MKVTPKAVEITPEPFEVESDNIGIAVEGTEIIPAQQKSVSEKDIATLNNYADKKLQETTQLSEVMNTVPSVVQRGGIYLISAAVGLTSILLYFSKVPIWIEASGTIFPKAEDIFVQSEQAGIVTAIKTKVDRKLAKDATLIEIKPTRSSLSDQVTQIQLKRWQTLHQKELEVTQNEIRLARLELKLQSQTKTGKDQARNTTELEAKIKNLQTEISTIKTKLANPLPSAAKDKITMPQTGIVNQLNIQKIGQPVSKDAIVATVIPDNARLTVEAVISDRDIAAVKPEMTARIKINAYDFREFGTIPAQVREVTPQLDRPGEFKVVLDLLQNKLTQNGETIKLQPGLTVQVEMQTEKKRLLQLLFDKR